MKKIILLLVALTIVASGIVSNNSTVDPFAALASFNLSYVASIPNLHSDLHSAPITCNSYCGANTISVSGKAQLNVIPDTAKFKIQIQTDGLTTDDAITSLSKKIPIIIFTITKNNFNNVNWQTTSLQVYANTSYPLKDGFITYGQIASQTMEVSFSNISPDGGNIIGKLYDDLVKVNGIEINGVNFYLVDKTASLAKARALAYANAVERAKDYTQVGDVTLGKAISIEDYYTFGSDSHFLSIPMQMKLASMNSVPTKISIGTIKISYSISAVFSFA